MGRGFRAAALCCAAAAMAVNGCGGGKNTTSSGGGAVVAQPKAKQPISSTLARYNEAVKTQSCGAFARLTFSQLRPTPAPGAPPSAKECRTVKPALALSKRFHLIASAVYGTAALGEGPAPATLAKKVPGGRARVQVLFMLDRDGIFRAMGTNVDVPQIGTKPDAGADDGGKNAQAVVDAIRAGDCKRLTPLIHANGTLLLGFGSARRACDGLAHGQVFAPALRETPNPTAAYLGGTRDYQFYGVPTRKTYFSLIMVTPPGTSSRPPLLYDAVADTASPSLK